MPLDPAPLIEVVRGTFRWKVAIDGVTESPADWFLSRRRAIAHAQLNARVLGAERIRVEADHRLAGEWLPAARHGVGLPQAERENALSSPPTRWPQGGDNARRHGE